MFSNSRKWTAMTSSEFIQLCRECEAILRAAAPHKTGNLRYNAIKLEMLDANTCRLYVDEDIAPYMKYTNEPWTPKIKVNGGEIIGARLSRNPNEGWFDRAAQKILEHIARRTKGELRK